MVEPISYIKRKRIHNQRGLCRGEYEMNNNTPRIVFGPDKITMYNDNGIEICSINREPTVQVQDIIPVDFTEFIPPKKGNETMELLRLYERRKRDEINKKYKELIDKEYNELDVVKRYYELVNTFSASLAELADEYCALDVPAMVRTGYSNDYAYELNSSLLAEIEKKYAEDRRSEFNELDKFIEEVNAMLEISNDKDYQLDVLEKYNIIKKGKLTI